MMNLQIQSTSGFMLFLFIALVILCATAAIAFSTVKSTQAELEHFAKPIAATATAAGGSPSSSQSSHKEFSAKLTGSKEVPPVDTDATGTVRLAANSRQDALDYQISLSNLNGVVTVAHIHRGSAGTNGPVVANLNVGGAFASASAGGGGGAASSNGASATASATAP